MFLLSIVVFSLFINQQAIAEDVFSNDELQNTIANTKSINQGNYIYDIQKVDPVLLAEDLDELKENLLQYKYKLKKIVENKKFTAGDTLITLIIPGGLLYASYRINELKKTKSELSMVIADIKDLSIDLLALSTQVRDHSTILALIDTK